MNKPGAHLNSNGSGPVNGPVRREPERPAPGQSFPEDLDDWLADEPESASDAGRRAPRASQGPASPEPAPSARAFVPPSGAERPRRARPGMRRRPVRRLGKVPLWPILVVLIAILLFAGWKLVSLIFRYDKDRKAYDEVASLAVSTATPQQTTDPKTGTTIEYIPMDAVPITVDWAALQATNPDVVAWLYCADTVINYPVVQTSDNTYYLTHGFDGSSNSAGCLFADVSAVVGVPKSNYIIYGHNMKDESMFGTLKNYVDESYYEKHPVLFLLTPTQNYRIEPVCCRMVEATVQNYPGYFSTTADYQAYLDAISADAYWLKSKYLSTDYQLVTLSTCTSGANYSDPRLVLQGALVPIA